MQLNQSVVNERRLPSRMTLCVFKGRESFFLCSLIKMFFIFFLFFLWVEEEEEEVYITGSHDGWHAVQRSLGIPITRLVLYI